MHDASLQLPGLVARFPSLFWKCGPPGINPFNLHVMSVRIQLLKKLLTLPVLPI
jgi:hypothetical protein